MTDEKTCDDTNTCTADSCDPFGSEAGSDGCVHIKLSSQVCEDGDPCTADDRCTLGVCKGVPSSALCSCFSDADCKDEGGGDLCKGTWICDLAKHAWAHEANAAVCSPDENPQKTACTTAKCQPQTGKCATILRPDGTLCSDGIPCTIQAACETGTCVATASCACANDADCKPLDDGNPYTGALYCDKSAGGKTSADPKVWKCLTNPASVVLCNKSGDSACIKNQCAAKTGKCHKTVLADGKLCDDGHACTVNRCIAGSGCVNKAFSVLCDDGNACTDDSCALGKGCVHTARTDGTACDDGQPCTTDACQKGACKPGQDVCGACKTAADCAGALQKGGLTTIRSGSPSMQQPDGATAW